jgi:hypothetical protein
MHIAPKFNTCWLIQSPLTISVHLSPSNLINARERPHERDDRRQERPSAMVPLSTKRLGNSAWSPLRYF